MPDVNVTLNDRTYRLECDDGEEKHLIELSKMVGARHEKLQEKFGQVGDDRLLLMTALMIADELSEMEKRVSALEQVQAETDQQIQSTEVAVAAQIAAVADRIEVLNVALGEEKATSSKA